MQQLLLNYLPGAVLAFIYIFCTFNFIGKFRDHLEEVKKLSSYKKLEDHMKMLLNENYDLKKDNKELKKQLEVLLDEFKTLSEEFVALQKEDKEEENSKEE